MNKNCAIARDLMPAVIDRVASAQSRAFVDEHVAACTACAQVYADMQSEIHAVETAALADTASSFKTTMAQLRKTLGWKRLKTAVLAVVITLVLLFGVYAAYYYLFADSSARCLPMDEYDVILYQDSDDTVYLTTFLFKTYQAMSASSKTYNDDSSILYVCWKSAIFPKEVEQCQLPNLLGSKLQITADGSLYFDDGTLLQEVRQGTPDDYVTVYQAGDALPPLDPIMEQYFRSQDQRDDAQQMFADAEQALIDAQDEYYDSLSGQTNEPAE